MAQFVLIKDIEDGQVLAEAVINNYAQVLLPAGAILTSKHKNLFKTWNISSVFVKTDESDEEIKISDDVKELAKRRLSERVKWKPRNANEEDLLELGMIQAVNNILKS